MEDKIKTIIIAFLFYLLETAQEAVNTNLSLELSLG